MKRLLTSLVMMTLLICMTVGKASNVEAANTRISSVSIKVEDKGGENYPEISLSTTAKCTITNQTEWEELNSSSNYEKIKKTLTIQANEGYEFRGKKVELTGTGKDNTTVDTKKESPTTLTVKIIYKIYEFYEPDNAYWDSENVGTARAERVPGAKKYKFILYVAGYDEDERTTSNTYYDFSNKLKRVDRDDRDDVYFEVCAIDSAGNESEYVESDTFNQWSRFGMGSNNGNTSNSGSNNSTCPSNGPNTPNTTIWPNGVGRPETPGQWVLYNGYWYFADSAGRYIKDAWIVYQGEWYLLSPYGRAYCNTWVCNNGQYYYFYGNNVAGHKECEMARNVWIGQWYVNNDGACVNY